MKNKDLSVFGISLAIFLITTYFYNNYLKSLSTTDLIVIIPILTIFAIYYYFNVSKYYSKKINREIILLFISNIVLPFCFTEISIKVFIFYLIPLILLIVILNENSKEEDYSNENKNRDKYKKLIVPSGTLKHTREDENRYNKNVFSDYFHNYNYELDRFNQKVPYGYNYNSSIDYDIKPAISSVNEFVPLPRLVTNFDEIGYLVSSDPDEKKLLKLFRRPISPQQDMYEYKIRDSKNKLDILLKNTGYLKDGDNIGIIDGQGPSTWRAVINTNNKFVIAGLFLLLIFI